MFIVAKNVFTVLSVHWSPLTFLVTISISTTPGGEWGGGLFSQKLSQVAQILTKLSKRNEGDPQI